MSTCPTHHTPLTCNRCQGSNGGHRRAEVLPADVRSHIAKRAGKAAGKAAGRKARSSSRAEGASSAPPSEVECIRRDLFEPGPGLIAILSPLCSRHDAPLDGGICEKCMGEAGL